MTRGTRERLRSTGVAPACPVTRGEPKYRYLTLDYPQEVEWEGLRFRTIEHAILASALEHHYDREAIARCATVRRARSTYNVLSIYRPRKGWTVGAMRMMVEHLLRERFNSASLREHLIGTHPALIQVGPPWLDHLLTALREEYRLGRD